MENCFSKKDFNPVTCKFSEKCKPGFMRNDKFRCVKKTTKVTQSSLSDEEEVSPIEMIPPKKITKVTQSSLSDEEEVSPIEMIPPKKTTKVTQVQDAAPATKKRRETAQAMKKKLDEIKKKVFAKTARRSDLTRQFKAFKPKLLASNGLNQEYNKILKQFLINYPGDKPTSFIGSISSNHASPPKNNPNTRKTKKSTPAEEPSKIRKSRKSAAPQPEEDEELPKKTKTKKLNTTNISLLEKIENIIEKIKSEKIVPIMAKNKLDDIRREHMTPNKKIEDKIEEAYQLLPAYARPLQIYGEYAYGYDWA
jgi:hypothetical protein